MSFKDFAANVKIGYILRAIVPSLEDVDIDDAVKVRHEGENVGQCLIRLRHVTVEDVERARVLQDRLRAGDMDVLDELYSAARAEMKHKLACLHSHDPRTVA